jgi:hypothetical protein
MVLSTQTDIEGNLGGEYPDGLNLENAVLTTALADGSTIKTETADTDTVLFQAYDVNGTEYKTFMTLTAGNTPDLSIVVPSGGTLVVDASTLKVNNVTIGATPAEINEACDVSAGGGVSKVAKIAFGADELGGVETNTSFTFPANGAILLRAWIYVADGESGTMDVGTQGTSNDPDGILDGITLTNTGWVFPTATLTTGLNGQYISATTFGALTHVIDLGTDDDGDSGFVFPRGVFITGADPVSITSSGDLNSCSGYLFLEYIELPSVA